MNFAGDRFFRNSDDTYTTFHGRFALSNLVTLVLLWAKRFKYVFYSAAKKLRNAFYLTMIYHWGRNSERKFIAVSGNLNKFNSRNRAKKRFVPLTTYICFSIMNRARYVKSLSVLVKC